MKYNTINTIIDDILLEINRGNISESEQLSRNQIEQWIIQYRAVLLKQDIDKNRDINNQYIQYLNSVELSQHRIGVGRNNVLKSTTTIPETIDFHFRSGIVDVRDSFGNEIQFSTERRAMIQQDRRYTSSEYISYIKGKYIYVSGPGLIESVNVALIAVNPFDISGFSADDVYPMPANMIPPMKDMIIQKEIRHMLVADDTNNAKDDTNIQANK
jgi:hypothetical protein